MTPSTSGAAPPLAPDPEPRRIPAPRCQRCGFELRVARPRGCRNPCPNCGTMYPLGDCSD